jgi:hypothetical protein
VKQVLEYQRGTYVISTDKTRLDLGVIHDYLCNRAYWALGRSLEVVRESVEHSLCFGVYRDGLQAGLARVVTDYCTFAWLCDVFILEPHCGQGLGKWLVECIVAHPQLSDLKLFILATRDAHDLYQRYGGFQRLASPDKLMHRPQA